MKTLLLLLLLSAVNIDGIIEDIYNQLTELEYTDYEELQNTLYELADHPIDLNHTSERELQRIPFLTSRQIDNILLYVHDHPMEGTTELYLVPGFREYEVLNLLPFVTVSAAKVDDKMYAREVFQYAGHEINLRVDTRRLEDFKGDPVYIQGKYKFNYANRVQFGAVLRRPVGGDGQDIRYGGYLQLNNIGILREFVAGEFQAQFGTGLVFSNVFHLGKKNYVLNIGTKREGLTKYTSPDGEGLQGVGATLEFGDAHKALISTSALYSIKRANDSIILHNIGANVTLTHNNFKIGLTLNEKIYSDSIGYFHEPEYTHNYFHGTRQAVLGLNARYHWQWFDIFGEVAAAQNTRWGVGINVGARFSPVETVGLVLLYRYYSPYFDNIDGYAFSETDRLHDENGGYVGIEWKPAYWRIAAYGDVFYFSGVKYGIPFAPSIGYDTYLEAQWLPQKDYYMLWQLRAREKGMTGLYSVRYQFNITKGQWRFRTQADANMAKDKEGTLTWGASVYQDVQYIFHFPLSITGRLQAFHAKEWANRIYTFENDVLYGFSIPALYGQGLRAYINMKYQPVDRLALYLRVSNTFYYNRLLSGSDSPTQTDIHLLARIKL